MLPRAPPSPPSPYRHFAARDTISSPATPPSPACAAEFVRRRALMPSSADMIKKRAPLMTLKCAPQEPLLAPPRCPAAGALHMPAVYAPLDALSARRPWRRFSPSAPRQRARRAPAMPFVRRHAERCAPPAASAAAARRRQQPPPRAVASARPPPTMAQRERTPPRRPTPARRARA